MKRYPEKAPSVRALRAMDRMLAPEEPWPTSERLARYLEYRASGLARGAPVDLSADLVLELARRIKLTNGAA